MSYHVFYQTSYLHRENRYKLNRLTEEVKEEDLRGDEIALRLQKIFLVLYGWQDRLMYRIDALCGRGIKEIELTEWYSDRLGLRISGLLGFGTEFAVLTVCSFFNELHLYLLLNVLAMNGIWLGSILYRKLFLTKSIARNTNPPS